MIRSGEELIDLGDEQLKSQFQVLFPMGIPGSDLNPEELTLRIVDEVPLPEKGVMQYERWVRGIQVILTGGAEETTKEITINIAIDQKWKNFDAINKWCDKSFDPEKGRAGKEKETRVPIIIQALDRVEGDEMPQPVKNIVFTKAKVKKLAPTGFNNQEGDGMIMALTFIFVKYRIESPNT